MIDLLAILAAFALVAVSPGPANLAVSLVAMSSGTAPAMRMAAGLATGLAIWGAAAAAGLGAALAASEAALTILRLGGGAYLLWLACKAARAAALPVAAPADLAGVRPFRAGLLLNLANPKAVFAWIAALSMGLGPEAGPVFVATATAACAALGLANYVGWALLMSRRRVRGVYARARRGIDAATAALFGLAGMALLRQGLAR